MVQRITEQDNVLSWVADGLSTYGVYLIAAVALLAVLATVVRARKPVLQS